MILITTVSENETTTGNISGFLKENKLFMSSNGGVTYQSPESV